jgi:hypothetical protein
MGSQEPVSDQHFHFHQSPPHLKLHWAELDSEHILGPEDVPLPVQQNGKWRSRYNTTKTKNTSKE